MSLSSYPFILQEFFFHPSMLVCITCLCIQKPFHPCGVYVCPHCCSFLCHRLHHSIYVTVCVIFPFKHNLNIVVYMLSWKLRQAMLVHWLCLECFGWLGLGLVLHYKGGVTTAVHPILTPSIIALGNCMSACLPCHSFHGVFVLLPFKCGGWAFDISSLAGWLAWISKFYTRQSRCRQCCSHH